jgi:hypothetical protein
VGKTPRTEASRAGTALSRSAGPGSTDGGGRSVELGAELSGSV